MDFFDARGYDFMLSRRARKTIVVMLMLGLAFAPSVRTWFVGQSQRDAEHVTRKFIRQLTPDTTDSSSETPIRHPRGPQRQGAR